MSEAKWITQSLNSQILPSFEFPKTPTQVGNELGIKKLKMKPFLEKGFLTCLNPEAKKGRFYILTNKARRVLKLPVSKEQGNDKDWDLIGWVRSGPRQRLVILKNLDSAKRTSEEIRIRASRDNPHLSRSSTKGILNELLRKGLVETQQPKIKRFYWVSEKGNLVSDWIASLAMKNQIL